MAARRNYRFRDKNATQAICREDCLRRLFWIADCEINRWNTSRLPNAIGWAVQLISVIDKILREDFQYNRLSVSAADLDRRFVVRRDVNKLPRHRLQSVLHDRIQKPRGCSVIQKLRRFGCLHFNDNARNWMPLIRADFCTGGVEWVSSYFLPKPLTFLSLKAIITLGNEVLPWET